jgi:septal ring factor EnvC (AmiA/AmiB activator)
VNEKVSNVFCNIIIAICITAFCLFAVFSSPFRKRPSVTDSRRSGQFGEQYRAAGELLTEIYTRISNIESGISNIESGLYGLADDLGQDAKSARSIAEAIRGIATEVKNMEDELRDSRGCLGDFLDFYYRALDAEIESELGIRIPK